HLADRVGQPDDDLFDALLARHPRAAAQALRVVRRVGELEPPDAVADDATEREPHQLLVARRPRDEAHAGGDVAERRARHRRPDEAEPLPRVLLVEAHRDCHVRARAEVDRVEADPVDRRRDRDDVFGGQAGRAPQALVSVSRRRIDDADDLAALSPARRPRPLGDDLPHVERVGVRLDAELLVLGLVDQPQDLEDVVVAERHQVRLRAPKASMTSDIADPETAGASRVTVTGRACRTCSFPVPRSRAHSTSWCEPKCRSTVFASATSSTSRSSSRVGTSRRSAGTSTRAVPRPSGATTYSIAFELIARRTTSPVTLLTRYSSGLVSPP